MMTQALATYRENFEPSQYLDKPYVMLAANMLLADDEQTARYHFTSSQQSFVRLRRGGRGQVPAPVESMDSIWSAPEQAMVEDALAISFVGSVSSTRPLLEHFLEEHKPDELMVTANVYDQQARLRSLELVPELGVFDLKP